MGQVFIQLIFTLWRFSTYEYKNSNIIPDKNVVACDETSFVDKKQHNDFAITFLQNKIHAIRKYSHCKFRKTTQQLYTDKKMMNPEPKFAPIFFEKKGIDNSRQGCT